jgi:transcriptional antiterminator RfaH
LAAAATRGGCEEEQGPVQQWHALFTKPRMERHVAETLGARDIDVFVPLLWYHGKRGDWLSKPFFPRYVFAHLDWEASGLRSVQWTPGLTKVVTFDGRPAVMPTAKLQYLRERLERIDGDDFLALKPGDRVKVTRGPFADVEAVFDGRLNGDARVAILLDILGRKTRVIVNAQDVERGA